MLTGPPAAIEPEGPLRGLRWRAIAYGALLDTVLTVIVFLPLYSWFAGPAFFSFDEAVANEATRRAHESDLFNVISLVAGGLCTVYAAYRAARRAGVYFIRHGGWVAATSALLALSGLLFLPQGPRQPVWVELLAFITIVPAGILGGHLAARSEHLSNRAHR